MDPERSIAEIAGRVEALENPSLERTLRGRLDSLFKIPGSLGDLEELVVRYGLVRRSESFRLEGRTCFLCIADHGVAKHDVSVFAPEVTLDFVASLDAGGPTISGFCKKFGIELRAVNCGIASASNFSLIDRRVGAGTNDFTVGPAMSRAQAANAVLNGIQLARTANGAIALGEMGIGNSTAASALVAVFCDVPSDVAVGPGSGVSGERLARKRQVVETALRVNGPSRHDPIGALAAVGGFEIATLVGLLIGGAYARRMVFMDGFICSSAALVAAALCPRSLDYAIFAHLSAEPAHRVMLDTLGRTALLNLNLRLGEGTGAVLALNLLDVALETFRCMMTLEEALHIRHMQPVEG